jgi:hypothetical protein
MRLVDGALGGIVGAEIMQSHLREAEIRTARKARRHD